MFGSKGHKRAPAEGTEQATAFRNDLVLGYDCTAGRRKCQGLRSHCAHLVIHWSSFYRIDSGPLTVAHY